MCNYSLVPRPSGEGLAYATSHIGVNLTNFWLKPDIPLFLRVMTTFEFHTPQSLCFSFPCFSVSYALRKLRMTSIFLKVKQRYSMKIVYDGHDTFIWLPTGYGKSLCFLALPLIMEFKLGLVRSHKHSSVLQSHGKLEHKGPYCVRKRHWWNPAINIFKLCIIDLYLIMHIHETVCTRLFPRRHGYEASGLIVTWKSHGYFLIITITCTIFGENILVSMPHQSPLCKRIQ